MIRYALILIPAFSAGIFVGCEKQPPAAATSTSAKADAAYTIRAVIEGLPTPDGKQFLSLHHEAIPAFTDREGKVVGMKEMIMPFPALAPGISLDGMKIGDAIELTFEVRWKETPRMVVTALQKLPEGVKPDLKSK